MGFFPRLFAVFILGFGVLGGTGRLQAQDAPVVPASEEEARIVFEEGRDAFEHGQYTVALAKFRRSYELSGRPTLLYNIGIAHDRLREDEEALDAFDRYLAAVPEAANRDEVESRAAQLRRAIEERRLVATESGGGGSVFEEWWFWTIVGAVVAGGVLATILIATDNRVQDPLVGSSGNVTTALEVRF
jgi:tetratricopeptide (TPR) repeat protein